MSNLQRDGRRPAAAILVCRKSSRGEDMQLVSSFRHSFPGWLIGLSAFAFTVVARLLIGRYLGSPASIEFVPAIIFGALFGGIEVGATVFVLSGVTLWFFFESGSVVVRPDHLTEAVGLAVFFSASVLILGLIRMLEKAIDRTNELARNAEELQRRTAVLFTELQHRVANNLGFISAVLNQERRRLPRDEIASQALAAAEERILTMSRIHRRFYAPKDMDQPARIHLETLCEDLIAASGLAVTCRLEADDTRLPLEQLIPVSLIASELITNCLKHAFTADLDGVITVRLRTLDSRMILLQVADNGRGANITRNREGLGATIMQRLALQLKAEIRTEISDGRIVSVTFPMDHRIHNGSSGDATAVPRPLDSALRA